MRKLDLSSISIQVIDTNGTLRELPYNLRASIEAVMLASGQVTDQRLSMSDLLRNARIAQKIIDAKNDHVLLEENEFQQVKRSFDAFKGFGKTDVELCKRIDSAETVEVKEKDET